MGYKRKAHVVFLAENARLADAATELGNQLGGVWLECRTAPLRQTGSELVQWADLLITLDGVAQQNCPARLPTVQHRHWPCPDQASIHDCLAAHIQSLLGGMKILDGTPPEIR